MWPRREKRICHLDCGTETLTKQSEAQETDVNVIVANAARTGMVMNGNAKPPRYGDFRFVPSLAESIMLVNEAVGAFNLLPAEVRAVANNDPARFLQMLETEQGLAVLKACGLPMELVERKAPVSEKDTTSKDEGAQG